MKNISHHNKDMWINYLEIVYGIEDNTDLMENPYYLDLFCILKKELLQLLQL